jgi:hypothetical protein
MNCILTDAPGAANLFTLSERGFHLLRKRSDWPPDAEVRLGPRCVRFRVDVLQRYAAELAGKGPVKGEPEQLRVARARREAQDTSR